MNRGVKLNYFQQFPPDRGLSPAETAPGWISSGSFKLFGNLYRQLGNGFGVRLRKLLMKPRINDRRFSNISIN